MSRIEIYRYARPEGIVGPETSPDYAKDAAFAERWEFSIHAAYSDARVELRPEAYSKLTRPTARSKWRPEKQGWRGSFWTRFDTRSSGIAEKDVPFPEDVLAEAIASVKVVYTPWEC